MRRSALWCLLLVPGLVFAQTTTQTPPDLSGPQNVGTVNVACGASFTVTWNVSGVTLCTSPQASLIIWGTSASTCETSPPSDGGITTIPYSSLVSTTGSFQLNVNQLPGLSSAECAADGGVNVTDHVCGQLNVTSGYAGASCTTQDVAPLAVVVNSQPPAAPDITSVQALDSSLLVHLSNPGSTGVQSTALFWRPLNGGQAWSSTSSSTSLYSLTATGLTNGLTYELQAQFTGTNGLVGPRSASVDGTPEAISGFYGNYVAAGGKGGGCSAGGGAGLLMTAFTTALWVFWRKRS